MNYKTTYEMPYNVCPKSEKSWNNFIEATLAGNALLAIKSYHSYCNAKKEVLSKTQGYEM